MRIAYLAIEEKQGFRALSVGVPRRQADPERRFAAQARFPPETPLARTISKDLQQRGFKFVGPTIVYAFMQAVGMVNDHLVDLPPPRGGEAAVGAGRMMAMQRGTEAAPRAWQRMLSGRRLDLLDPSPLDIEIEDIAHGLARVARWNGQTQRRSRFLGGAALHAGGGDRGDASSPSSTGCGGWRRSCMMRRNMSSAT